MSENTGFKPSLSLLDATMIVSGSMIGSGIFIVSADITRTMGCSGYLLLTWIVSGVLTMIAALCYGELAGMMPKAGGQYVYLREAYNPLIGFLFGWTQFLVIQAGAIAAVAVAFAKFTAVFFPFFSPDNVLLDLGIIKISAAQCLAIASLTILTLWHTRGIQGGKMVQNVFTGAKLIALGGLILMAAFMGFKSEIWSQNWQHAWEPGTLGAGGQFTPMVGMAVVTALGVAMVGSLFSSDAWNNVTFIAGEIKNPSRNIPLSLFFGTLIVSVIYILVNIIYLGVLPLKDIAFAANDRVGTAAAGALFGNSAAYLMAGLIMVSTFGCNNGLTLSGARLCYAMAKDKLFLSQAATLNDRNVPSGALYVQLIWASILCLSGTYGALLDYTIFAALLFYVLSVGGIIRLRRIRPDADRPYRAFGYPILPILYIIVASAIALILLFYKSGNTIPGLIIVLLGIPVYYWQMRRKTDRPDVLDNMS
jgi:APA family basic amino acid/polyamine antiporter